MSTKTPQEPKVAREAGSVAAGARQYKRKRRPPRELGILASVVLCAAVFGLLDNRFIRTGPALTILNNMSTDGLMLIGMTVVIVCGAFDLSVGSTLLAGGLTSALLMKSGCPVPLAVLAGLLSGALIGCANGLVITRLKINPFIATLGTMSIVRGLVLVVTKSIPPSGFAESFGRLAWADLHGIPFPVILMVVCIVVADVLMRRLRYLRQAYFVGSNEDAAALTGINVSAVKMFAFILTGVLSALAGIMVASKANSVDPNEGLGAELRIIAAVIVGGASLSGGRGTVLGSFLGLLLMQTITTGLVFVGVPPDMQLVAVGLVLILAVLIDQAGSVLGKKLIPLLTQTRSRKVERVVNVVLGIALVVVLLTKLGGAGGGRTAGAGPGGRQKYVEISLVTGHSYWIDGKAGLRDKAKELGVDADFQGPANTDANQQIQCVERAIAQKVDGLLLVPSSDGLTPVINKAIDSGIPVICVDTDAPSSKRYCFIGTGNYNAGYQGGLKMAELLHGRGDIAILTVPGQVNLGERVQGYRDALKKYPDIRVIQEINSMSSQNEATKQVRAMLQAHPDIAGFACVEAGGGVGIAVAVKESGKAGKIKIVAMDRDDSTLHFIEEGVVDASVAQRSYTMTYEALQMLYDIRNGRVKLVEDWKRADVNPLPPYVDTGSFIIDKSNVRYFYHKR